MEVLSIVSLSDTGVRTPVGRTPAVSREHSQLHRFRQDIKVLFLCIFFSFSWNRWRCVVSTRFLLCVYQHTISVITPRGHGYGCFWIDWYTHIIITQRSRFVRGTTHLNLFSWKHLQNDWLWCDCIGAKAKVKIFFRLCRHPKKHTTWKIM